jgi:hypothetical protein
MRRGVGSESFCNAGASGRWKWLEPTIASQNGKAPTAERLKPPQNRDGTAAILVIE